MNEHTADYDAPEPYEAQGASPVLTDAGASALNDVMVAVNGFYYPGDRSAAVLSAVAWLQTHPRACAALGLTRVTPPASPTGEDEG